MCPVIVCGKRQVRVPLFVVQMCVRFLIWAKFLPVWKWSDCEFNKKRGKQTDNYTADLLFSGSPTADWESRPGSAINRPLLPRLSYLAPSFRNYHHCASTTTSKQQHYCAVASSLWRRKFEHRENVILLNEVHSHNSKTTTTLMCFSLKFEYLNIWNWYHVTQTFLLRFCQKLVVQKI